MALWLFYCGFSFLIPNGPATEDAPEGQPTQAQLGNVATAIFLFMATYSPGEGPVPFTYSAEAFPLYIRDVGMSFATATCWGFNFILSLTWPALVEAFTPTGAFCWYAGWNLFGWVYCYFFLPETVSHLFPSLPTKNRHLAYTHLQKNLTLEELDTVFNVGNRAHSSYYAKKLPWYFNKHILRRDVEPAQPLFSWGDPEKPIKSTNETEGLATRQAGAMGKDEIWGRGAMTTGLGM